MPKYKMHRAQKLSPVHSIAMEWNKLDKTLKNYILDMSLTFETKKKKLKFYYLHGRQQRSQNNVGELQDLVTYNVYVKLNCYELYV